METQALYGLAIAGLAVSFWKDRKKTTTALKKAWKSFEGILPQFLVVLVLVAVTLAVLDTAAVSRFLGSGSGIFGILGASLVGAITLIPGFIAFPAAAALLRGGAGATQIAAFVSSLMMVGIVTLPMEMKYFGKRAAVLRNVFAWLFSIGAWSTTKIPMLLFEISAMGPRFALARLAIDIVGIVIIAWAIKALLPRKEVERLYAAAETAD